MEKMSVMKLLRSALISVCMLAAVATQASTQYEMTQLNINGCIAALKINNEGQILGCSNTLMQNGNFELFLWSSASGMDYLGMTGCPFPTNLFDINNKGQVVGNRPDSWPEHDDGVIRETNGDLVYLDGISEQFVAASAINDKGWVVGRSARYIVLYKEDRVAQCIGGKGYGSDSFFSFYSALDINNDGTVIWHETQLTRGTTDIIDRDYVWSQGKNTLLQTFGSDNLNSWAYSINNSGTIVGVSGGHAVAWNSDGSIIRDLGEGCALGINKSSQIIGQQYESGYYNPVLWNPDGTTINLSSMNGCAYGINDLGQVVGSVEIDGFNEEVLWQPVSVPEPASFAALALGALGILSQVRKRRS